VWAGFTVVPLAVFFGAVHESAAGGAMTVLAPDHASNSAAPAASR
jgi:hypothetical protein